MQPIEGLVIVDDMMCTGSSISNATRLYRAGKEVYRTKTEVLNRYISGRSSTSRAAVLAGKRVFFINSLHQVISLLMDKDAIDRGDQIETEHHSLQSMICIWADDRQFACLTDRGDLNLVDYKAKPHTVKSVNDLRQVLFPSDRPFKANNHESVSITGCTQYLAVAKSCIKECTSTVALLNRNGIVLSTSHDNSHYKSIARNAPIHNMQFIVLKRRIFLVAQNLYSVVRLFLINPKNKAAIHYIRTFKIAAGEYNLPLIPIPSQPDHLITCSNSETCRVMQITLNYGNDSNC